MGLWDKVLKGLGIRPSAPARPEIAASEESEHGDDEELGEDGADAADGIDDEDAAPREQAPKRPRPSDERVARAHDLDVEARVRAALATNDPAALADAIAAHVVLVRHGQSRLPCLCRRCLGRSLASVEVDGERFSREVVVHGRVVLPFWAPEEVCDDAEGLRRSMRDRLRAKSRDLRLARRARLAAPGGVRINPFTKEPM